MRPVAGVVAAAIATAWGAPELRGSGVAVLTDGVPDCQTIPNYWGKCFPSISPGACWAASGDADPQWQCWNPQMTPETMTDDFCKTTVGKRGACKFQDYNKDVTDKDLKDCSSIEGWKQCGPLNDKWGACYKAGAEGWQCVPKGSAQIYRLRLDCRFWQMADVNAPFDGACVYGNFVQEVYKCNTVPTYNGASATTSCKGPPLIGFACFSLKPDAPWQCVSNGTNPSCITTPVGTPDGLTYDGACVNENDPAYPLAKDASGLTTTVTTTTTATPLPVTTTTQVTTTGRDGRAFSCGPGLLTGLIATVSVAVQHVA